MRKTPLQGHVDDLIFEMSTLPEDSFRYAEIERELREIYQGMPNWKFRTLLASRKAVAFVGLGLSILLYTIGLDEEWKERLIARLMNWRKGAD